MSIDIDDKPFANYQIENLKVVAVWELLCDVAEKHGHPMRKESLQKGLPIYADCTELQQRHLANLNMELRLTSALFSFENFINRDDGNLRIEIVTSLITPAEEDEEYEAEPYFEPYYHTGVCIFSRTPLGRAIPGSQNYDEPIIFEYENPSFYDVWFQTLIFLAKHG